MSRYNEEQIKQTALNLVMDQIVRGEVDASCRESLRVAIRQARQFAMTSLQATARVVSDAENALVSIQADCLASSISLLKVNSI